MQLMIISKLRGTRPIDLQNNTIIFCEILCKLLLIVFMFDYAYIHFKNEAQQCLKKIA